MAMVARRSSRRFSYATASEGAPATTLYVREAGPADADVPPVTVARESGPAAEAPVLPCSASLCSTPSGPGRVLQRCGNSGTFGSRPGSFAVLYRTTQPDNAVQERSR